MALYIDCASLQAIRTVAQTVPLAGVTTNPSILLAAREAGQRIDPPSLLKEMLQTLGGTIFMQPGATTEDAMFAEALSYVEMDPERVVLKIPMTHTGMRVAMRLKLQRQRVAFTAVVTVAQAYTAAMVNADFIIPYYNRLKRSGIDADDRIAQIAELLHNQQLQARILAASIKSPNEAISALSAGAHDITAPPQVLLDMLSDSQTDEAVEKFSQDWQKLNRL